MAKPDVKKLVASAESEAAQLRRECAERKAWRQRQKENGTTSSDLVNRHVLRQSFNSIYTR